MTHRKTNAGAAISGVRRHLVLVELTSTLPDINRRHALRQDRCPFALQEAAAASGLTAAVGQDAVQRILADAFGKSASRILKANCRLWPPIWSTVRWP
jgi:hypothetical protein